MHRDRLCGWVGGAASAAAQMLRAVTFLVLLLQFAGARFGVWQAADEEHTDSDPWTPCEKNYHDGQGGPVSVVRGFCRLSCTAKWSYAPERMDCRMLPLEALLSRSHSRGLERFRALSQDSFSKVNSGISAMGTADPDVA